MEIRKKTWPEYFEKVLNGEKNIDLRLADFELNKGDILVLEEYNPQTKQYTGRVVKKKVVNLIKVNPTEMVSSENIEKFGFYEIELEKGISVIQAQEKVDDLIQCYGGYWQPLSMLARLVEETGELSRAMNIKFGNKKSKFEGDGKELNEELADVLFTILAISNMLNVNLGDEVEKKLKKDFEKCKGVYDKR